MEHGTTELAAKLRAYGERVAGAGAKRAVIAGAKVFLAAHIAAGDPPENLKIRTKIVDGTPQAWVTGAKTPVSDETRLAARRALEAQMKKEMARP